MITKIDQDMIQAYLSDSSHLKGFAEAVIIPESIEEVSAALAELSRKNTPVTLSSGGTATTGSRSPQGGVVLSLERLDKVISIDGSYARVQAGVSVDNLRAEAQKRGLFYACHPTERQALVGGTIATNASGARSYKYGSTRKSVQYVKVILSSGDVLELRRGEQVLFPGNSTIKFNGNREIKVPYPSYRSPQGVKNSSGYYCADKTDAVDLFIGQEGTLGAVVEAEISLPELPEHIIALVIFLPGVDNSCELAGGLRSLRGQQGIPFAVLSIEYFDKTALGLLAHKVNGIPAQAQSALYVEIELRKEDEDAALSRLIPLIESAGGDLENTWVANTPQKTEEFSSYRHAVPEVLNEMYSFSGFQKFATDIAVPHPAFRQMMRFYVSTLEQSGLENTIFGHIGESHVHVNMLPRSADELGLVKKIAVSFIEKGISLGGTVSAEHGIGKIKHQYLEMMYGRQGVIEMARIKKAVDPAWILSLGNIFPESMKDA